MSMLDIHDDALESSNNTYHDFLLYYRLSGKMVYAFLEGKTDSSFYRSFIENLLPPEWNCKLFQAGNKDKVLTLFASFDWTRFPRKAICFFVDRDLSEFLGGEKYAGENLFVSKYYSIENELVTEHMLERVLDEVNCVGALAPKELEVVKNLFQRNLAYFKESLVCIMAQIILWRRAQKKGDNLVARLDKIKVRTYFDYKLGVVSLKPEFTQETNLVQDAAASVNSPLASTPDLTSVAAEFRKLGGIEKFIRGKYLLIFFIDCAEALRLAIPNLFMRKMAATSSSGGLGAGNAVMIIGPRARCPASLQDFLRNNYLEYIRGKSVAA